MSTAYNDFGTSAFEEPDRERIDLELKPESIEIVKRYDYGNGNIVAITQVFRAWPDRGTIINLAREGSRRTLDGDEFMYTGDPERIYDAAYNDLVVDVRGYTVKGREATLDEVKAHAPIDHKKAAINAMLHHDVLPAANEAAGELLIGDEDEQVVELSAVMGNFESRLIHHLKPVAPFALTKLRRQCYRYADDKLEITGVGAMRQAEELYDAHATSVQGYRFEGADLMTLDDWKRRVPLNHKASVIGTIAARIRGTEKN